MSNKKPTINVFPDKDAIAERMAEIFVELSAEAIAECGVFVAALSGGGTPKPLYERLAQPRFADQIDWAHVHFFWGDERVVPPTDDGSNYKQVNELLLEHVPIPERNVWRVKTEYEPEIAAHDYMRQLEEFALRHHEAGLTYPRFDLVLLGMGSDGHTASLFPFSPLCVGTPTLAVSADYDGRPSARVTLTETVFNSARNVYVLVTGEQKAKMVNEVLNGEQDWEARPIQRVSPEDGELVFMLDEAAASQL